MANPSQILRELNRIALEFFKNPPTDQEQFGWKEAWQKAVSERPDLTAKINLVNRKAIADSLMEIMPSQFSGDDRADTQTRWEWDFGEFLDRKTKEMLAEARETGEDLSYSDALSRATEKYPEFAQGYLEQIHRGLSRGTASSRKEVAEAGKGKNAGTDLEKLVRDKIRVLQR